MSMSLEQSIVAYNKEDYYKVKLEQGLEFQDLVSMKMYKKGWPMVGFASRKYQFKWGENIMGAEIKNDTRWPETGNLCIETAEKAHPTNSNYIPSGILREDNSVLYIIGTHEKFWVLSTSMLRLIHNEVQSGVRKYRTYQIPTSMGFLMPIADADAFCIMSVTDA